MMPRADTQRLAGIGCRDWPWRMARLCRHYAAARYSSLTQIDRTNAKNICTSFGGGGRPDHTIEDDNPRIGRTFGNESAPLMAAGILFTALHNRK
jgi:hypothetical protein